MVIRLFQKSTSNRLKKKFFRSHFTATSKGILIEETRASAWLDFIGLKNKYKNVINSYFKMVKIEEFSF